MAKAEDRVLARAQADPGAGHVAVDLQAGRRGQQQPVRAAAGSDPCAGLHQDRADQAEFRPGRVRDIRLDFAAGAG
jgi:hypothetical protein